MIMTREDKIIQKFIEKFPWERLTDEQHNKSYFFDYIIECVEYVNTDDTNDFYRLFESEYVDVSLLKPQTVSDVIKTLQNKYKFDKWQYFLFYNNKIETVRCKIEAPLPLLIVYPDYENNIKVMDREFNDFGYFNSKTYKHTDKDGREWCLVTYNPKKKYDYSDVKHGKGVIYHIAPIEVLNNIKKDGIVPTSDNSTYNGESRSFFFKDFDSLKSKESITMMKGKAEFDWKKKDYCGLCAILTIEAKKIPDSVKFYLDPNAEGCIFCNDVIKPQWIAFDETQVLNLY